MARREVDEWFWQIGTELQRLSEEMLRSGPTLVSRKFWEPRLDVFEDETCLVVKAEIAGVRAEDLQLVYNADRNSLIIRGIRKEEDFPSARRTGCYQLEIFYGE
ncbi:MAG TPA: hypothetical protein VM328_10100, partial [Fimbriimonadaceae bacterium]|nr:hypothetical protein [Fimbriimonadaceae bacterium]